MKWIVVARDNAPVTHRVAWVMEHSDELITVDEAQRYINDKWHYPDFSHFTHEVADVIMVPADGYPYYI